MVKSLVCASSAPGSIVHHAIPSASSIYCPTELVLQHLSFQLRGFDDALVHLDGHQVSSVLEIVRPYEQSEYWSNLKRWKLRHPSEKRADRRAL